MNVNKLRTTVGWKQTASINTGWNTLGLAIRYDTIVLPSLLTFVHENPALVDVDTVRALLLQTSSQNHWNALMAAAHSEPTTLPILLTFIHEHPTLVDADTMRTMLLHVANDGDKEGRNALMFIVEHQYDALPALLTFIHEHPTLVDADTVRKMFLQVTPAPDKWNAFSLATYQHKPDLLLNFILMHPTIFDDHIVMDLFNSLDDHGNFIMLLSSSIFEGLIERYEQNVLCFDEEHFTDHTLQLLTKIQQTPLYYFQNPVVRKKVTKMREILCDLFIQAANNDIEILQKGLDPTTPLGKYFATHHGLAFRDKTTSQKKIERAIDNLSTNESTPLLPSQGFFSRLRNRTPNEETSIPPTAVDENPNGQRRR